MSDPSMYAPVSAQDAARLAQQRAERRATCNTALLAVAALCLAILVGRGGSPAGSRGAPPALSDVPGLPRLAFTEPGAAPEDWDSTGEGPMPLWYHLPTGRVWADVSGSLDQDMLVVEQVTQGVGVRGLWDAGSIISQRLINFRRVGPKILLVAIETAHRSSEPEVTSSVEQSFANSVMWTFAAQEDGDGLYIDLGINWWDQAFQSAGFPPGTFSAELQPPDVPIPLHVAVPSSQQFETNQLINS